MKFELSKNDDLKTDLVEYKETIIVLSVFVSALLLFIFFILPSIIDFPLKLSERNVEVEKLDKIKQAQKILEATDSEKINEEIEIVSITLPSDKNFELILGAISEAATRSNSQITGYKFNEGRRAKRSKDTISQTVNFEISVLGGVEEASNFARELKKTYPISDILEISFSDDTSEVIAVFYYKPITSVKAQDVALARQKTAAETKALDEVSGWNLFSLDESFIQQISSQSANPF